MTHSKPKRRSVNPPKRHKRPMTPQEREDAHDLMLAKRTLAKGGKTFTHAQVMREFGFYDLIK